MAAPPRDETIPLSLRPNYADAEQVEDEGPVAIDRQVSWCGVWDFLCGLPRRFVRRLRQQDRIDELECARAAAPKRDVQLERDYRALQAIAKDLQTENDRLRRELGSLEARWVPSLPDIAAPVASGVEIGSEVQGEENEGAECVYPPYDREVWGITLTGPPIDYRQARLDALREHSPEGPEIVNACAKVARDLEQARPRQKVSVPLKPVRDLPAKTWRARNKLRPLDGTSMAGATMFEEAPDA